MVPDRRLRAWVDLASVEALGNRDLHRLLTAFGSPEGVFDATVASLSSHVSAVLAQEIRGGNGGAERAAAAIDWAAEPGNHLLTWDDPDYPKALLDIGDAPCLLYYKGRRDLLNAPALAVVGSRNASPSGTRTAEEFAEALAAAGLTIVSGMALGIDSAAHRGAMRAGPLGGSTVAVVGTGIDRIYPPRNRTLAHQIAEQGGLLSEFALGTPPVMHNFPRRNRLISGLARGVLVVEAALGSGSLITARCAGEQGREVFAIPGSIHSPTSKGCHKLIREGAKLVETASDILDELQWKSGRAVAGVAPQQRSIEPAPETADLLLALGFDPVTPDELAGRLAWPIERLTPLLLELELSGAVGQTAGGRFQRTR